VIAEHDRDALERLCRYGARPAFAQERLAWTDDGRIAYQLKRPWPDGRTALVMPQVAFLRRLCGIIPPPLGDLQRDLRARRQGPREIAPARARERRRGRIAVSPTTTASSSRAGRLFSHIGTAKPVPS
jgi:hypothetical protein